MPVIDDVCDFRRHDRFDDWWVSEPISIPFFDGSPLPIRVIDLPESKIREGRFPEEFSQAVGFFLQLANTDRRAATRLVFAYYKEYESYCGFLPRMFLGKSQVWHYSRPRQITVLRHFEDKKIYVVVNCECDWEEEHGMSLVFQDGYHLCRVGPDDGHIYNLSDHWLTAEQDASGKV